MNQPNMNEKASTLESKNSISTLDLRWNLIVESVDTYGIENRSTLLLQISIHLRSKYVHAGNLD